MASISSIKIIAGAFSLANLNTSLTILGPSPRYFWTNSDPTTLINAAIQTKNKYVKNVTQKYKKHLRKYVFRTTKHAIIIIKPFEQIPTRIGDT